MAALKKNQTPRNEKFLAWVRGQDSCVSRDYANVVTHHVRMYGWGGMGIKPSDYRVVPLTHAEHLRLHHHGEASFWEEVGIDPRSVIAANMLVYLRDVMHEPYAVDNAEALAGLGYDGMIEALESKVISLSKFH
jgi:hypothetical protein